MKPATKESVKIRQLTDYPAFAAAKAKLDQLNEALAATNLRIDKLKIQSNRVSSEARHYLTHGIRVLALEDSAIEKGVVKIIAAGCISRELMAEMRHGAVQPPFTDSDLEIISEIQEGYAAQQLFGRAIAVQQQEVSRLKKLASLEICNSLRGERERIARAVADALVKFAAALREEYEFADRLRAQDAAIPALLSPRPFPVPIPSDPAVIQWIEEALGVSEIDAETWLKTDPVNKELPNGTRPS